MKERWNAVADDPEIITDDDNPEWTKENFAQAKPFKEVFPAQFEAWQQKRGRGRPTVDAPKSHFAVRMDPAVIDGIKATGKGYNARVESVLREALAAGKLDPPRDLPR